MLVAFFLVPNQVDALQRYLESVGFDPAQRVVHVLGDMAVHVADEAQGEMIVLRLNPTRSRHPVTEGGQGAADRQRQTQGDEQADHGNLPLHRTNYATTPNLIHQTA